MLLVTLIIINKTSRKMTIKVRIFGFNENETTKTFNPLRSIKIHNIMVSS
jgi:hypothetical protein